jgi:hypothetical protein
MGLTEIFSEMQFELDELVEWDESDLYTRVIMISGKAGVGKTTLQNALVARLAAEHKLVAPMSFARPLKAVAMSLGWDGTKDEKGRKLLQDLGRTLREYDKDTWVRMSLDLVYHQLAGTPPDYIIYDDWRFPNELDYLNGSADEYKVITVRVLAPSRESLKGQKEYFDVSELALDNYTFDIVIDNDTITKEEFEKIGVEQILNYFEKEED